MLWRGTVDTFKTLKFEKSGQRPFRNVYRRHVSHHVHYTSVLRPPMREYNTRAIRYPLRRCTFILNQGRGLPPLSFLSTSHTRPRSCNHSTSFPVYGCFSDVCPASPAIQGINLTPLSAEPYTMTTRPLRGIETTTLQLITSTSPSNSPPLPNPTRSPAKRQQPSHGPTRPKSHWAHA